MTFGQTIIEAMGMMKLEIEDLQAQRDEMLRQSGQHSAWIIQMGHTLSQILAQRDELARVLLAVEWGDSTCLRCGRYEHEDHATDCALDAALRKAGVR